MLDSIGVRISDDEFYAVWKPGDQKTRRVVLSLREGEETSQLSFYRSLNENNTQLAEIAKLSFKEPASSWEVFISRDETNRLYLYAVSNLNEEQTVDLAFESLSNVPSWDRTASRNFVLDDDAFKDYEVFLPDFFADDSSLLPEEDEVKNSQETQDLDDSFLEMILDSALRDEFPLEQQEKEDLSLTQIEDEELSQLIDLNFQDLTTPQSQRESLADESSQGEKDALTPLQDSIFEEEQELSLEEVLRTLDTPFPSPLEDMPSVLDEQTDEVLPYPEKKEEIPLDLSLEDSSFQTFLESLEETPLYASNQLREEDVEQMEKETTQVSQGREEQGVDFDSFLTQEVDSDSFKEGILKSLEEEVKGLEDQESEETELAFVENWSTPLQDEQVNLVESEVNEKEQVAEEDINLEEFASDKDSFLNDIADLSQEDLLSDESDVQEEEVDTSGEFSCDKGDIGQNNQLQEEVLTETKSQDLTLANWSDLSKQERDFLQNLSFEDIAFVLSSEALPNQNLDEDIKTAMTETVRAFNFKEEEKANPEVKREPKNFFYSIVFMGTLGCMAVFTFILGTLFFYQNMVGLSVPSLKEKNWDLFKSSAFQETQRSWAKANKELEKEIEYFKKSLPSFKKVTRP